MKGYKMNIQNILVRIVVRLCMSSLDNGGGSVNFRFSNVL